MVLRRMIGPGVAEERATLAHLHEGTVKTGGPGAPRTCAGGGRWCGGQRSSPGRTDDRRGDRASTLLHKALDRFAEPCEPASMPAPLRRVGPAASLGDRAEADLRFIRGAMERSGSFTAVPGRGGMAMGAVALVAASAASFLEDADARLALWVATAAVAIAIGAVSMQRKAAREGIAL